VNPKSRQRMLSAVFLFVGCCVFAVIIFAAQAFADAVSSTELINNAAKYDSKIVTYAGEVIGDIMVRKESAWINIYDGKNAIGVWLAKALSANIVYSGSYTSKGDWVEVTGIFQRACYQHGGDLDIHAHSLRKLSSGSRVVETMDSNKKNMALILLFILGALWILRQLKLK